MDYDGTELQSDTVDYGETPEYTGKKPTKDNTSAYSYDFLGWDQVIEPAYEDRTYTAVYDSLLNSYNIYFLNDDFSLLHSVSFEYGLVPSYSGNVPEKEADAQYTYVFAGWSPSIEAVTGDRTYIATYNSVINSYTVKFIDEDGTELQSGSVEYGKTPIYSGATPTKEAGSQYTYNFAGWSPSLEPVTGDKTYTATYSNVINSYTIKFVNEDGTELQSGSVEYGKIPVYSGTAPTKEGDAQYTYNFAGWSPSVEPVTGDKTYTAVYDSVTNRYSVKFVDYDGVTELKEEKFYDYGTLSSGIEKPDDPTREADKEYIYAFAGWTPEISDVTANVVYSAEYSREKVKYPVKWVMDDGTEIDMSTVEFGETPTHAEPTKEADSQYYYVFSGWKETVSEETGEMVYTAMFKAVKRDTSPATGDGGIEMWVVIMLSGFACLSAVAVYDRLRGRIRGRR